MSRNIYNNQEVRCLAIRPNPKNKKEISKLPRYPYTCPQCRNTLFERKDWKHGNHFCEECGFVSKEIMVTSPEGDDLVVDLYPEYNNGGVYEHRDINKLRDKYEKYTNNRQEYRIERDYKHYCDIVASNFKMTRYQKEEVLWYIRVAGGVNKYCKNCTYEQIILSLCVMVMRADKRRIKFKDYKIFREEGLEEGKYIRILENVIREVK